MRIQVQGCPQNQRNINPTELFLTNPHYNVASEIKDIKRKQRINAKQLKILEENNKIILLDIIFLVVHNHRSVVQQLQEIPCPI